VTTNVIVPDGATLMIGGLIENIDERSQNGIPLLARLPLAGALFRERTQSRMKKELIVFLTPRVMNPCPPGLMAPGWPPVRPALNEGGR
jgi:type II secretory pathway component HofQ